VFFPELYHYGDTAVGISVNDFLSQDQGAMMFGGPGVETTQVSIPNNVRKQ